MCSGGSAATRTLYYHLDRRGGVLDEFLGQVNWLTFLKICTEPGNLGDTQKECVNSLTAFQTKENPKK